MKPIIKFSIIICTYNRLPYLKECVQSLVDQQYSKSAYEIIVVDDGSTDDTKEYILSLPPSLPPAIVYIRTEHKGPAHARNEGTAAAHGEILAFLDDDCEAPPDWLENIESAFRAHPEISGLGSHTLLRIGGNILDKRRYWGSGKSEAYMPFEFAPQQWLSTHNFAVKKDALAKINGFRETADKDYEDEDLDLMYRLLGAGCKLLRTYKTVVYHRSKETIKDTFRQQYIFGKTDTGIFIRYFSKWFVLDLYTARFLNLKEFFYIKKFPVNTYIRIDFFKLFIATLFFVPYLPYLPIIYLLFMWLAILIKERGFALSLKLALVLLTRDFAYMLGHIRGSIRYGIIYI